MQGPEILLKAGEATFVSTRYGDYAATALDPHDNLTIWHVEEYAKDLAGVSEWGTWVSAVQIAGPPPPRLDVGPTGPIDFGTVRVGSTADRTFTVQNTGGGTLTGTVTPPPSSPFSIVAGASFSLGAGASQTTPLRFAPTSVAKFAGTVAFNSNAGSVSRLVSGEGIDVVNLTVTETGSGSGTVTSNPAGIICGSICSATFARGTSVTLTATPASGSVFAGWTVSGCSGTGTRTMTLAADSTVSAAFTKAFTLTVAKAGNGSGTVTSSPTGLNCGATCSVPYAMNTIVTLNATPATGSVFTGWSGGCTGPSACTITLKSTTSVTATFVLQTFSLAVTLSGTGGGTVTSNPSGITCGATCAGVYNFGTIVTITAVASAGATFTGWGGACSGTTGRCAVTMTLAQSVTASFSNSFSGNFTDDPLVAQSTVIKAAHITELRLAIDAVRVQNKLSTFTWTDPSLTPGTTPFKTVHLRELRTALNQVYQILSKASPVYTDPSIVAGQTVIRAIHEGELRGAVRALQ